MAAAGRNAADAGGMAAGDKSAAIHEGAIAAEGATTDAAGRSGGLEMESAAIRAGAIAAERGLENGN